MAATDRIAGCALVHLGLWGAYLATAFWTKAYATEFVFHGVSLVVCVLGLACCPEEEA